MLEFMVYALIIWLIILNIKVNKLEKLVKSLYLKQSNPPEKEISETINEEPIIDIQTDIQPQTVQEENSIKIEVQKKFKMHGKLEEKPSKLLMFIKNYFTGGNLLVRIGGVVLFFGLAFLLKYAADHSFISIKLRLLGVVFVAIALIIVGIRLKDTKGAYGQILQGVGVATLYLVIYTASKFYGLMNLNMAFILMLTVVIFGSILAIKENSLPLASFATAGGFMVPILTSSGSGSHIVLFSYYLLLNLGVFALAWYKSWRILNLLGFIFTFIIATAWGVLRYKAELFASTEIFLILFFAIYLAITVIFTLKHKFKPKDLVDGTLTFGLPIIAFTLQTHLAKLFEYGEAVSAIALGVVYLLLHFLLKQKERTKLLSVSFFIIAITFFTIAIPYIFGTNTTATLWAIESAGGIWLAIKQERRFSLYIGLALLFVASALYLYSGKTYHIPVSQYLGAIIVMASLVVVSWWLDSGKFFENQNYLSGAYLLIALAIWFANITDMLDFFKNDAFVLSAILSASIAFIVSYKLKWQRIIYALQSFFPLAIMVFYISKEAYIYTLHPFKEYGFLAFALLIFLQYSMLFAFKNKWKYIKGLHLILFWFIITTLTFELHYHIRLYSLKDTIQAISWVILPTLSIVLLMVFSNRLKEFKELFLTWGVMPIAIYLILWQIGAFFLKNDFNSLTVLNPIDLMQIAIVVIVGYWVVKYKNNLAPLQQGTYFIAIFSTCYY